MRLEKLVSESGFGHFSAGQDAPALRQARGPTLRCIKRCSRVYADLPWRHSARVAQLDRASASGAEGCGFDPRLAYQVA
jgi:hypothetical protein